MRERLILVALLAAGCTTWGHEDPSASARRLTGGDPERGRHAALHHGCASCHEIPGVPGARATIGPSLRGLAGRATLAGRYSNSPAALEAWIQHPQALQPGNIMPDVGVSDADARDLAAYLYTLR